MQRLTPVFISFAILPATAAVADLNAEDVWSSWTSSYADMNAELSAETIEDTGNGLILRGVTGRSTPSDDMPEAVYSIDEIRLTESGGGVDIEFSPESHVRMSGPTPSGETDLNGVLTLGDGKTRAEGSPEDIAYSFDFPEAGLSFTNRNLIDGVMAEATTEVSLTGLSGTSSQQSEAGDFDMTVASSVMTSRTMSDGVQADMTFRSEDGSLKGEYQATGDPDLPMAMNLAFSSGPTAQDMRVVSETGPVNFSATGESGEGTLQMGESGVEISYLGTGNKMDVDIVAAPVPLPKMQFDLGDVVADLSVPYDLREDTDWQVKLGIGPFSANEETWATFDPNGHIDRAPGRLNLDLNGSFTTYDGTIASAPEDAVQPERLEINDLLLAIGGAALSGNGAFDLVPNPQTGTPNFEGRLNLALEGGLSLINQLAATGLLQQEQLMGLQMMLGMMAVRDGEADRLSSVIETGPGERVMVNGMQIR